MLAQAAALKEVANSKVHGALAYNQSFEFTDVTIGDTAEDRNTWEITTRSSESGDHNTWERPGGDTRHG